MSQIEMHLKWTDRLHEMPTDGAGRPAPPFRPPLLQNEHENRHEIMQMSALVSPRHETKQHGVDYQFISRKNAMKDSEHN